MAPHRMQCGRLRLNPFLSAHIHPIAIKLWSVGALSGLRLLRTLSLSRLRSRAWWNATAFASSTTRRSAST
jgi:hypothetical protein